MKVSYNWLKNYLACDLEPQQIADIMTSIGIEVNGVEEQEQIPGGLSGVVVAEVLECEKHPNSDHLHICKVNDGTGEPVAVVCGAPNVAAGQKVLFARIGTVLPGDFKIKKSKIRGVESFGMICAEDELGIGADHEGIMVLPQDAVAGTSAKEYLNLESEAIIEYEITANRVDAASHIGVARDLYAYMVLNKIPCELKYPDVSAFKEGSGKGIPVEVLDHEGSPRYAGITLRGVKVEPSPEWLQKKLTSIGLHPINNIVDISNFILFELGQPLHMFDASKIIGGKVIVRRAAEGELIRTLDGVERKLSSGDMVIANEKAPMCIAGVFGGAESGLSDSTTDVFIESAYFDPASIRRTSKTHGLQTDASFRYERGGDPDVLIYALKRAALLILEIAGGRIEGPIQEDYPNKIERKVIELDYAWLDAFAGQKIGRENVKTILSALQYRFIKEDENGATLEAPSYMVDVYRPIDVVEEILRIYGYDNIDLPMHMKMSVNPTEKPSPEALRNQISNFLAANGFAEIMNNSLTKSSYYEGLETFPLERCVRLVNPLSSDLDVMRQTLLLGGLEVVAYNANRQNYRIKTFEYGSVYQRLLEKSGETPDGYEEHTCFTLFLSGSCAKNWNCSDQKSDFFHLKGYLELLLKRYGADLYNMPAKESPSDIFSEGTIYYLPGGGQQLAVIGVIHPSLAKSFGIKQEVVAAEIDWNALFTLIKRNKIRFTEIPQFPQVRRDLALLMDESVCCCDLRATAFKTAKGLLRQVGLFDVYRGKGIPEGKKQYAMSFVFRDDKRTLTDEEVERKLARLLEVFKKDYGVELR